MSLDRPLRILHIHHGRVMGGAPLSLGRLIGGLDPGLWRSEVLLPGPGPAADYFRGLGCAVDTLPLAAYYYLAHQPRVKWSTRIKHAALSPFTRRALRAKLATDRPALVHLNTALLPVCGAVAAAAGVPVIWHIREVLPNDDPRALAYLLDAARRHATTRVAISAAAAAPFRACGPVEVIPEGVDAAAWWRPAAREPVRSGLGVPPGEVVLLYPAALSAMKGQPEWLEALPRLTQRLGGVRWRLWCAGGEGEPGIAARLARRAAELGVADRISWLGWRDDLPELMAGADLVLFRPTRAEGFGLPLIEAMAAGRPVVTGDAGPAREIVVDGETGRVVPQADMEGFVAAVAELIADAALRERLGAAGRRRARDEYGLDAMRGAFARLFEAAVGGDRGARNAV